VTERRLTPALRLLVSAFGLGVLALGLLLAAVELLGAYYGASPVFAILAAAACILVAVGGASLVRTALRGRITLRRVTHRRSAK
jgi:hypothetical protein